MYKLHIDSSPYHTVLGKQANSNDDVLSVAPFQWNK